MDDKKEDSSLSLRCVRCPKVEKCSAQNYRASYAETYFGYQSTDYLNRTKEQLGKHFSKYFNS